MTIDRSDDVITMRLSVDEAALVACALDGYGDAIDPRCAPMAREMLDPRHGVVTIAECRASGESAPNEWEV